MRVSVVVIVLAVCACNEEGGRKRDAAPPAETSAVDIPVASGAMPTQASAMMMAIPSEPEALKRLEAMGYTVHREEEHLHAPGVKGCPAMTDGPVM